MDSCSDAANAPERMKETQAAIANFVIVFSLIAPLKFQQLITGYLDTLTKLPASTYEAKVQGKSGKRPIRK
jgi:hypothetical protein